MYLQARANLFNFIEVLRLLLKPRRKQKCHNGTQRVRAQVLEEDDHDKLITLAYSPTVPKIVKNILR